MRLRRMKLVNFRGIHEREIRFGDGVTIVEGPNEIGKSSFQDALDLLFRRKDNATAGEVADAVPLGQDVGPEVEAEIETGPYVFVYRKRFRRRPETVLRIVQPRTEQLVGDQAHERSNEILGETLDRDLWDRLRVRQGERLVPTPVGDARVLMTALDELTSDRGAHLPDGRLLPRVESEYRRYFTMNRGAETGELQRARAEAQAAQEAKEEAQTELGELEDQIEDYERRRLGVVRLERRVSKTKAEELKRAAILRALEAVQQRVGKAQTAVAQAETTEAKARNAKIMREALRLAASEAASALQKADEKRAGAEAVVASTKTLYDEAGDALREAQRLAQAAEGRLTLAQCRLEYLDLQAQRARLRKRVERIEELNGQVARANATYTANPVDSRLIAKVRDADRIRREAEAALKAGAPEVSLRAEGAFEAIVNGEEVTLAEGDQREYQVDEELRLELPDMLKLRVRPGASLTDLQAARSDAESLLKRLLDECGTENIEGAERRSRKREEAKEDAKTAGTEASTLLGNEHLSDLRAELARMDSKSSELAATLDSPDDIDASAAAAACEEARNEHDRAVAKVKETQAARDGLSEPFIRETERLEQAQVALEEARTQERNASAALAEAREQVSDASVDEALAEAETELGTAQRELSDEQRRLDDYDEESIRTLAANSRKAADDTQRQLNEASQAYAGVRSLVEAGREKGLFARASSAQDQALASVEKLARVEARANGAKRLLDVLTACRKEAYEKHRAPFRERVEKLSRLAFGKEVRIELAEDLTVARRTMDGITLEFHQLSGGAQEQLGLASRLATAMLLGDDGGPLLLDDTLGHSDPERLRGLGAMIGAAAQQAQVVIFTCQPDRFAHLGGARSVRL